jgi:hypothetical protein
MRTVLGHRIFFCVMGHVPAAASVDATTASCCTFISIAHDWKYSCAMSVGSRMRGGKQPMPFM